MSAVTGESATQAPGVLLSTAREQAGLSLTEVAQRLHLDLSTLEAMEAGRFETLGAQVFVRGHLRRYAELLSIPIAQIDAAYAGIGAQAAAPDLRRIITRNNPTGAQSASLSPRVALIGAIALVLLGLVWWAMHVPHAPAPPVRAPVPVPAPTTADPPTAEAQPAATLPATAAAVASATPASAVASAGVAAGAGATPTPAKTAVVHLALRFYRDSWAEVYDSSGRRLVYGLQNAGADRRLSGAAPLHILLGNPDGVKLELDGRSIELGSPVETGSAMRFSLDGGGRVIEVRAAAAPSTDAAAVVRP